MEPAPLYRERLQQRQATAAAAYRRERRLGALKLTAFFLLLLLAWLAAMDRQFSLLWLLPALAGLATLFVLHDRALASHARARRAVGFYRHGLARLEDRWSGQGPDGARFRDPAHPYADDLDLFGPGSLFQWLCAAQTPAGECRLAEWLRSPAEPAELRRRHARVAALVPDLDQRERMGGLGSELAARLDPDILRQWSRNPLRPAAALHPLLAALLAALVAAVVWATRTGRWGPVFALVLAQLAISFLYRGRIRSALGDFGANARGLRVLAAVLGESGESAGVRPLRRLARLQEWSEVQGSLLGHLLDATLSYSLLLSAAADHWRRQHGAAVDRWLDTVAEFEALLSLATVGFEHPGDPLPELVPESGLLYQGDELGHPLLPAAQCVTNSIRLDASRRLLIVSGSNMSGKSTLLRTVGINAVLALMGAPVRARRLRISPLAIGTRLRTADSLQLGRSGFYAEILRLRQIHELSRGPRPLLYLLDELLEGTNSHDRVVGARGLLQALLQRPALGLVTTHDLALTALQAEFGPAVENVHFEDQIEGDDVRFDHRLRPGVVTRSNALALMRIVGLGV